MEAIRLTKINGEKFFVNINEVSHFESVKKGMVVHFESGDSIRVRETFPHSGIHS